jgi:hypothetical protein
VDGDVAVATSVEDFAPGVHHVWVWRRVGGAWVDAEPIVPLQAPQTADGAQDRVALDDGVLAIGRNDLVHVYRDDGQSWNLEAVLSFAAPGPFGRSLALEGDLLVVGRPVPGDGTVHVYRHGPSGWAAEDVLRVDDPQLFGASVAIRENEIFVGDSHDSTNGPLAGAVHRFQAGGGGWWHEQTLFGAEGAYEFGRHVAADGWWLLVEGSHEVLGAHPPVLSFFRDMQGPWLLVDTEPLPVEPQGTQSADIDLEGDLAIAGMPSVDGFAGAVASFRLQPGGVGWDAVGAVTAPQPGLGDRLGQSVALDGDRVFASAPQHDGFWSDLGHLYEAGGLPGEAW